MPTITQNISNILAKIHAAEVLNQREHGSTQLLVVTKQQTLENILIVLNQGYHRFGESFVQEALVKIQALQHHAIEWHFIGNLQANKTKPVATHFAWCHSLDKIKNAKRLNDQRPKNLPPLNVCIQVNIDEEPAKSGIAATDVVAFAESILTFPKLKLRGLMAIPKPTPSFESKRKPFHKLHQVYEKLLTNGFELDTLSMGMSQDFEAAIAEGSTLLRLGKGIFKA